MNFRDFLEAVAHRPAAPRVLLFPPHPDDETLTGLLPLRLREEVPGTRVDVLPATYGSNEERRPARRRELEAACAVLGFQPLLVPETGFAPVEAAQLAPILGNYDLVVAPHHLDGHPRHRKTSLLLRHALKLAALPSPPSIAETDYWMPNDAPNLLVEASPRHLETLKQALECHAGEVARNDYHLRLAAWMSDNVRRAAEWLPRPVGTPRGTPAFPAGTIAYGTLYKLRPLDGRRSFVIPAPAE